jgi:hypothetical protein
MAPLMAMNFFKDKDRRGVTDMRDVPEFNDGIVVHKSKILSLPIQRLAVIFFPGVVAVIA